MVIKRRLYHVMGFNEITNSVKSVLKLSGKASGIIVLIIGAFVLYHEADIIRETMDGRDPNQIDYASMAFPLILFVLGFFMILKKKKNEPKNPTP